MAAPKQRRGFASMSPETQREIARIGGRAAHRKGTAHQWTSEEAREAGRKGGFLSRGGRGKLPAGVVDEATAAVRQYLAGAGATDAALEDELRRYTKAFRSQHGERA